MERGQVMQLSGENNGSLVQRRQAMQLSGEIVVYQCRGVK